MAFKRYLHNTPHRMVTANSTILGEEAVGMTIGYDPLCAECNRVGFCSYDQGPCTIGGPDVDDCQTDTEPEPDEGPDYVYSWTDPCPACGAVHPV